MVLICIKIFLKKKKKGNFQERDFSITINAAAHGPE